MSLKNINIILFRKIVFCLPVSCFYAFYHALNSTSAFLTKLLRQQEKYHLFVALLQVPTMSWAKKNIGIYNLKNIIFCKFTREFNVFFFLCIYNSYQARWVRIASCNFIVFVFLKEID